MPVEKRGTGRYRARYNAPGGLERSKTFARKVDADDWLIEQRSSARQGAWVDPARGRITLADWVSRWAPTTVDLRPTTRALNLGVVRNHLLPRFGTWPIAAIRTSDVTTMVAEEVAAAKLSASAIRRHAIVLGVILEAAVADQRLARNPVRGVKLPPENARRMRVLEPDEVVTIATVIGAHHAPLIFTAAYTGLRWGELTALSTQNLDLLARTIRVERTLTDHGFGPPKTAAGARTVTMPAALAEVLGPHLGLEVVQASGLVFCGPQGAPLRRGNFNRVWRRACVGAGFDPTPEQLADPRRRPHRLEGFVFHELRHTAAALAIAQGAHPLAIKERLGHSSITVTMDRYGHLFPRLEEQVAEGLDEVLRSSLPAHNRPAPASELYIRRSKG